MELTTAQNRFLSSVVHSKLLVDQYRIVYETTPERNHLLNAVAPTFFGTVQRMWLQRMVLDIRKIMDPPVQGSNRNLTLDYFIDSVEASLDSNVDLETCRDI